MSDSSIHLMQLFKRAGKATKEEQAAWREELKLHKEQLLRTTSEVDNLSKKIKDLSVMINFVEKYPSNEPGGARSFLELECIEEA